MPINHYAELQKSILRTDGLLIKIKNLKLSISQKARMKEWAAAEKQCTDLIALYDDLLAQKEGQRQHLESYYQTEYDGPDMEGNLARSMAKYEGVMDKTRVTIANLKQTRGKMRRAMAVQYEEAGDLTRAIEIYEKLGMHEDAVRVRLFMDM